MLHIRGHFDGSHVVLDEPIPIQLRPNTQVEVVVFDEREKALAERDAFLKELWSRPIPPGIVRPERRWTREELYERGSGNIP